MAEKTFNTRIKHKKDTEANWTTNNPVLLDGEIAIVEMPNGDIRQKIGNGEATYTSLPFDSKVFNGSSEPVDAINGDIWIDTSEDSVGNNYVVPISQGGTGATDKNTAKINLGIIVSTSEPTPTDGSNGDIWLVVE